MSHYSSFLQKVPVPPQKQKGLLSVVISSRHDALRKKRVDKPEAFQPGGFGARILGQFSDSIQVGAYVLLKTKYMLCGQVMDVRERKPHKPMKNKEFDQTDQVDEAMRSIHSAASKIAMTAEELSTMVNPKKQKKIMRSRAIFC